MELGINTLGGVSTDRRTGQTPTEHERLASIVTQGVLAERLGFEAFSVGEHHGDPHFVTSAPPVILAAIAAQTERLRLMTGVTLLPLLDPVRVAEDYATLDVLSGGVLRSSPGRATSRTPPGCSSARTTRTAGRCCASTSTCSWRSCAPGTSRRGPPPPARR
nr:LLM class flavin-dependent oxidoreductase [Frankia sp. ArI3]